MAKQIIVYLTHGQPIPLAVDFTIENNNPIHGLVRIKSGEDIYWVNYDHIVWIGPR